MITPVSSTYSDNFKWTSAFLLTGTAVFCAGYYLYRKIELQARKITDLNQSYEAAYRTIDFLRAENLNLRSYIARLVARNETADRKIVDLMQSKQKANEDMSLLRIQNLNLQHSTARLVAKNEAVSRTIEELKNDKRAIQKTVSDLRQKLRLSKMKRPLAPLKLNTTKITYVRPKAKKAFFANKTVSLSTNNHQSPTIAKKREPSLELLNISSNSSQITPPKTSIVAGAIFHSFIPSAPLIQANNFSPIPPATSSSIPFLGRSVYSTQSGNLTDFSHTPNLRGSINKTPLLNLGIGNVLRRAKSFM